MTETASNDVKMESKAPTPTQNQNTAKFKMAQQTVSNGSVDGNRVKSDINGQEMQAPKEPLSTSTSPQPSGGPFIVRPPVSRSDSRPNFQYRPPFPPNAFSPNISGPQSLNPQITSGYQATSPVNSGPHSILRPGTAQQQFAQRGPPSGPRLPPGTNPNLGQQRPIFRPQSPFQRAPLLGQRPQVFQQSSVPALHRPRPALEDTFTRSQTLDSAELDKYAGEHKGDPQRPPSVASMGRSLSSTSSNQEMERKVTQQASQESINDLSRQSSAENVLKKEEIVPVMEKIAENQTNLQKSLQGDIIASNGDITIKSPSQVIIDTHAKQAEEDQKKDLQLKLANKGDNDSGVDESTQGNDQSCNGDSRSPRKPNKSRTPSTTPTKNRSVSRGSKTPTSSVQSPDSAATTPGSAEIKKVPMNKVQVGAAPPPNLKVVRSKIGSLDNAHYKPGGGKVRIENKKLDFKNAGSKIEAKNDKYVPKGGEKKGFSSARSAAKATSSTLPRKILSRKLEWNASSKIGSLENAHHKPKGGDKKIESVKLNFKDKAAPKVGSKDNIKHQPGGGDVKIENRKIELNATSKVGSLDNVKHKPSGGEKKIFDDKEYLKQTKQSGKDSLTQSLSGSQHSVQSQDHKTPVADENLNQEH